MTEPAPDSNTTTEEADERFRALTEGILTTLPGAQVLFGFLLAIPFQTPISSLTDTQQRVYLVAFVSSALSSLMLIAPSVHQRVRVPRTGIARRHMRHVRVAAHIALGGTVLLFVAVTAAVHLVLDAVFGAQTAVSVVVGIALLTIWAWFYLPLVSFSRSQDS